MLIFFFNNTSNPSILLFPSEKKSQSYNLDVYEIQKDSDSDWDLNGTYIVELKPEGYRFSNPNIYAFINEVEVRNSIEKVAYKIHYNIAIAIDNTSHKIPEVRAGPFA